MPEQFGAYMFELLFAPLRKVRKTANQFYLFFQAAGRHLDACKGRLCPGCGRGAPSWPPATPCSPSTGRTGTCPA